MTASGVFNIGEREFAGDITTNANGDIVSMQGKNGQNLSQVDVDNFNKERMHSERSGYMSNEYNVANKTTQRIDSNEVSKTVSRGDSYNFNDQAVAQAIAAGRGDTSLGVVKEQYDNMQANIGNDNYSVYKENYNKALAEYSISAANGLSSVVGMSQIGSTNKDISETNTKNDTTTISGSAKGGLGISGGKGSPGEGTNLGVGFSIEKSHSEQDSLTAGKSERITNQFTRNELTSRIRDEVTKGLDQGLSADQIDKNINENILSR